MGRRVAIQDPARFALLDRANLGGVDISLRGGRANVSRILSRLVIYLGLLLPIGSSGSYDLPRVGARDATYLLAAGRVYLFRRSPAETVSFYLTLFTSSGSFREQVVLFLWHFPWDCSRLPLATAFALYCPDFPLPVK